MHARFTSRHDGDVSADRQEPAALARRWHGIAGRAVTWLDQQHTDRVLVVDAPAVHRGAVADGLVTDGDDTAVAVWVGDCAPVLLVGEHGPYGVVHAGWRGLAAGVLARAVVALGALGAGRLEAWLGPCIHPCCYEFGADDLAGWRARHGDAVVATTAWGAPALHVPAAVGAALDELDVPLVAASSSCTGCDTDYWSFRRRGDTARHGLVAWRAP